MEEYRNMYVDKRKDKKERKRRKRVRRMKKLLLGLAVIVLILLIYIIVTLFSLIAETIEYRNEGNNGNSVVQETDKQTSKENGEDKTSEVDSTISREHAAKQKIENFANAHNLTLRDYPEEIIETLVKNSETEEFVLNYPLKKGDYSKEDLDECLNQTQVPLILQWDSRWGYYEYGSSVIGVTGCGPTCLSMVSIHLLQDSKLTPVYMADYAKENGYYAEGIGTAWDFMTYGARNLGLKVQEVTLDENVVTRHLRQGRPIICTMGPGDFTESGHFIVLVGVEDGKIRVNDPNSKARSEKLWDFDDFKYQIKNMWAYSVR